MGWQALRTGEATSICLSAGKPWDAPVRPRFLLPGSFNPLHAGHLKMFESVKAKGGAVAFEISLRNVDKPELSDEELTRRVAQFSASQPLWLTAAPTFDEKSLLFPGVTFVVGADTLARIADSKYYSGKAAGLQQVCRRWETTGVRFLVFGRSFRGGFQALADLDVPAELARLCRTVSEQEFRIDISSTELRQRGESL